MDVELDTDNLKSKSLRFLRFKKFLYGKVRFVLVRFVEILYGSLRLGLFRSGSVRYFISVFILSMKKYKRQPKEIWQATRARIWARDGGLCTGPCQSPKVIPLNQCHIDHIRELSCGGTNSDSNLRVLCRRCHVLRLNKSHRGMIAAALKDGIIPPNWRELMWEG